MTIRIAGALALLIALALALPAAARADEERFSLALRGAGFDRDDGGYADHAEVYGLSDPEVAGGGVVEAGVRFMPRLWLLASWSGFTSSGARRLAELTVDNQALLAQIGFTAYRGEFASGEVPWWLRVDLVAGGGLYTISDELGGERHTGRGPGARVGGQLAVGWKAIGLALSYGWHLTGAHLDDRVGGSIGAGGFEFGAGLRLAF